eukprot:scaffold11446_cov119-Isochrysis_galbana.AAC.2
MSGLGAVEVVSVLGIVSTNGWEVCGNAGPDHYGHPSPAASEDGAGAPMVAYTHQPPLQP